MADIEGSHLDLMQSFSSQYSVNDQQQCNLPNLPIEPKSVQSQLGPNSNKRSHSTNWVSGGGPGTQAFFLNSSSQPSCGTGVFLPGRAGNKVQYGQKKACCPVLLPAHVLRALNLEVHEWGLHITRREGPQNHSTRRDCNGVKNTSGKEASGHCHKLPQNENCSTEILLPEEWTY